MDRISLITALFARALAIKSIGGDSLSYIGVTTTALTDGATTNPITIDGDTVTATNGNVALYSGDAFVFNGTIWQASSAISQIFTEIGDLTDLDTEAKSDLVSAINEVNEEKQDDVELSLTPTAVVSDRDIIDGQGNTLSVLAEALTKTASGNPITITDCAGGKARSLKTAINAIQDLHGLPFPYVGGAYKNKLPMTVEGIKSVNWRGTWSGNVYTLNGGTFTIVTDDSGNVTGIKVNGTFTATSVLEFPRPTLNMSYILNGVADGASADTYKLQWYQYDGTNTVEDTGSGTPAFTPTQNGQLCIRVYGDVTVSNKLFKPMIRLSTESDASFAPYSNICPISGRTEARVDTENEDSSESAYATIQLGQTVYGADINWDTGVCTPVDTRYDLGNITYSYHPTLHYFYGNLPSDAASPISGGCDGISSIYKVVQTARPNDGELAMLNTSFGNNKTIWINDSRYTDPTEFKTAVTGQTVTYPLAEPSPIQLTPTQLSLLKGDNRITIDNGNIDLLAYIGKAWS